MNSKTSVLLGLVCFSLVGCGPRVEVQTATVGRVVSERGMEKELRRPSTFRLPWNFLGTNPTKLVLVEASDKQKEEQMTLFMPKDKLIMSFDVRGTYSVATDDAQVDKIYQRLVSTPTGDYTEMISFDDVYGIYAQLVITTTCRAVLTRYDIEYVTAHREEISDVLEKAVKEKLADTPVVVKNFRLSNVQPPALIVEAQKATKEREVAIEQAKADRLVRLTEAEAAYEVALKQQDIDLLAADTQRLVGQKLTKGVNLAFIQQRVLNALDKLAKNKDRILILPDEALKSPGIMTGVGSQLLSPENAPAKK